jgi:hypothetical protein
MDECDEDWGDQVQKPVITGTVTTEQIREALDRVYSLAVESAQAEQTLKNINKLKHSAEMLAVSLLEHANMEEFAHKELGKFSVKQKSTLSFKNVDKSLFYPYLREIGQFDNLATINAQRFVGWYNDEYDRAVEEGRGMEFSMPGVPEPGLYPVLKYKKPKLEGTEK